MELTTEGAVGGSPIPFEMLTEQWGSGSLETPLPESSVFESETK